MTSDVAFTVTYDYTASEAGVGIGASYTLETPLGALYSVSMEWLDES